MLGPMRLLLVRHAIAVERAAWALRGRPEGDRPLTDTGRARFRKVAAGLQREVASLDRILVSPLRRAVETAALLGAAYGKVAPDVRDEIAPGAAAVASPAALAGWLATAVSAESAAAVALVGQEPQLSLLAGWLLTGEERSLFDLRKGGACLLELAGPPAAGTARLLWLLEPRQARRLAR
jgi:phosphohistidine phosphatase